MPYWVDDIRCDTPEEAQRLRERLGRKEAPAQPQHETRPAPEHCSKCDSAPCLCRRISTGYLSG